MEQQHPINLARRVSGPSLRREDSWPDDWRPAVTIQSIGSDLHLRRPLPFPYDASVYPNGNVSCCEAGNQHCEDGQCGALGQTESVCEYAEEDVRCKDPEQPCKCRYVSRENPSSVHRLRNLRESAGCLDARPQALGRAVVETGETETRQVMSR